MTIRIIISSALGPRQAQSRADRMARALGKSLGERCEGLVARDYQTLYGDLSSGRAELGWCPAAVCSKLEREARSLFASVRDGVTNYHAALVCRQSQPLQLSQLPGTRAAWVDKSSFGGYLLAAEFLRKNRLDPTRTFRSQKFYGAYPAAVAAVLDDQADVTSVTVSHTSDDAVRRSLRAFVGNRVSRLAIVAVTDSIPSDSLVLTRKLPDDLAERLEQILEKVGPFDEVATAMSCEGFRRAAPGEYRAVGLSRFVGF